MCINCIINLVFTLKLNLFHDIGSIRALFKLLYYLINLSVYSFIEETMIYVKPSAKRTSIQQN